MFNRLNISINSFLSGTNKSNEMDSTHVCAEKNCTGKSFYGLNLTCSRCLQPKFFDCISELPEIKSILAAFQITNDLDSTTGARRNDRIKSVFYGESVFEFVCPLCKSTDSFVGMKTKLDKRIETLEKKNKSVNTTLKQSQDEVKSLNSLLKKTKEELEALKLTPRSEGTTSIDLTKDKEVSENDKLISELREKNLVLEGKVNSIVSTLNDVKQNFNTHQAGLNKIKSEFDNAYLDFFDALKPLTSTDFTQSASGTVNENEVINSQAQFSDIPSPQSGIRLHSIEDVSNIQNGVSNQNVMDQNFELKPPTFKRKSTNTNDARNQDRNSHLYEIHVTKFDKSMTSENIISHIVKRTNYSADTFAVDMLANPSRLKRKTFLSFKISTLRKDVCDTLLSDKLWAPNFSARLYDARSPKTKKANPLVNQNKQTNREYQQNRKVTFNAEPNQQLDQKRFTQTNTFFELDKPRQYRDYVQHENPQNRIERGRFPNSYPNSYQTNDRANKSNSRYVSDQSDARNFHTNRNWNNNRNNWHRGPIDRQFSNQPIFRSYQTHHRPPNTNFSNQW